MRFGWIRKSVKNKIIAVNILVVMFFGGMMIASTFYISNSALVKEKRESLKEATISESLSVSMSFDQAVVVAKTTAKDEEAQRILQGKAGNLDVADFLNEENVDENNKEIFLVNKEGKTVGSNSEELKNKDFSQEGFFAKVAAGDEGVAYLMDFTNRKTYFYAYSPVRSSGGEMLGAVITKINNDPVFDSLTKTSLHDIGHLMVVDSDGMVVHSTEESDELKSLWTLFDSEKEGVAKKYKTQSSEIKTMQYEEAKNNIKGYSGAVIYDFPCKEDAGESEMMAISQIGKYPLFLATEFETEIVTKNVIMSMLYILGLGVILLIALVIVLNFLLRRILKPMKIIRSVIESISRGHVEQDIPIKGQDEFKELGNALDTMVKRLQEKDVVNEIRRNKGKSQDK